MRKLLVLSLAVAIGGGIVTNTAQAHLLKFPDSPGKSVVENRLNSQSKNLAHAKYVCNNGKAKTKTWHCKAAVKPGWLLREHKETYEIIHPPIPTGSPQTIICHVFGSACQEAITVARCETGGTFSIYAANGQYLGLFQMGESERAKYGHGWTAYEQARAAKLYYNDSGWSPWQCSPYGGLKW